MVWVLHNTLIEMRTKRELSQIIFLTLIFLLLVGLHLANEGQASSAKMEGLTEPVLKVDLETQ